MNSATTDRGHPPGPRGNWLLGNLGLLQRDILTLLEELPRQYGDIVRLRFAGYRAVLLSHPEAVEQVLVTQGKKFEKPPRFRRIVRPAFGNGLFANQGDAWTQQRRRMQTALDGIDLDSHCQTVVQCTQQNLAQWRDDEDRDLVDLLVDLALAARAKTSLGLDRTDAFRCIHAALGRFMEYYAHRIRSPFAPPLWVPTGINRNMRAALKLWWSAIDTQVRRAAQDELPENHLLSKLLQLRQAGSASAMTRSELNDELATWLLTGTETTANTLAWTCYLLARDAEQQAQLYEQVQSALQGRLPGRADLKRLPQLEAVLWEAMRLYPQAYLIGRKAVESFVIDGYHFPEKTTVILNQWSIGRDPRWFREPTRFDPGRWRDGLPDDLPKFAFFPFGGGGRICLGRSLAQLEMPLVLAMLLQRFRFELGAQPSVRPCPSLTLRPMFGQAAIRLMRR